MSRGDNNNGRRASGRQGGNYRKKSFSRGNAPIKNEKGQTGSPGTNRGGSSSAQRSSSRGNAPLKNGPMSKPHPQSDLIRLNKYIANSGVCSRREADTYIAAGNVTVNGDVITEMGYKVTRGDTVRFDGRILNPEKKEYILLNKPKNFITTTSDEKGRRTVMELVANATNARLVPVGRLDRNTTGLLLFTNDGDLAKKLTHPKHGIRKLYHVVLNKNLKAADLKRIKDGLEMEDGTVKVDDVSYIQNAPKKEVGIQLHSGRNRIVRRIFEHLGYEVNKLDRVIFAGLTKKDLPRGHWRHLTKQEIINLGNIN